MTEKRFIPIFDGTDKRVVGAKDDGKIISFMDMFDLLNNLSEENEQLKSTINTLTHDNTKMKKVLNTTKKENEQIKHLIKEAYHNERTELGRSVIRQLMEAIQ